MRTQIFAYKGVLGAITDLDNGKFLNDPRSDGQFGVVVPVEEIDISPEAVSLLLNAPREGGSFAPIMLTKHSVLYDGDSKASIGLFGFWKHLFKGSDLCIGRDCDKDVLNLCNIIDIIPPDGFKSVIDELNK